MQGLRRDLHRESSEIETKNEDEILAAMKLLAVKKENNMVARVQLHNMTQDNEEGVRNFAARLRGQADVCKLVVRVPDGTQLPADISYREHVV